MGHQFIVGAINDGRCMYCGKNRHESIHKIDLNPSDERLREMIAEKDAEIASLKKSNDAAQDTVQRQWETIQLLQRDAERYRKLKSYADQSQNQTAWGWSVDFPYADDSIEFDDAIDALPKAK